MKLVFVYVSPQDASPGMEWRFIHLARVLNRRGDHPVYCINLNDFLQESEAVRDVCAEADLILIQAEPSHEISLAIQHWKAQGKVVLIDLEDRSNLSRTAQAQPGGQHCDCLVNGTSTEAIETALRLSDGAILPFASSMLRWNGHTRYHVIPSYIDLENLMSMNRVEHDGIVVGWHHGLVRGQPVAEEWLAGLLERVSQSRPNVRWMPLAAASGDFKAWPKELTERFLLDESRSLVWPRPLGWVDIGLVPQFDVAVESLARINTLEYMALKIPWIGSETGNNFDLRPHGWLVNNANGSWERILMDMIDHIHIYQRDSVWGPYVYGISQGAEENLDRTMTTFWKVLESAGVERESGYGQAYTR
ncbi:hypothetical protein ADN00_17260 [Ornatilinea apprima]|uniref:Uncharacterized protein n=1 Tax=Ornatilinea apprima TaxID=1134406 RepID=A0A0P6XQ27_9CHLR|nr:hypothetical protein [Ornatilinea apprima]KPL71436.1 hypothetical protein ADN00_17260 [Ornatilinea apprima]